MFPSHQHCVLRHVPGIHHSILHSFGVLLAGINGAHGIGTRLTGGMISLRNFYLAR
jgi:hypothetical protein